MHPLIDGILAASRARGFAAAAPWPKAERRDLIASARALKSRGFIPIIAEIKPKAVGRALTPEEVAAYARAYSENNACAISVLTEPTHFKGALQNALIARRAGLPVLRKDFIFDERQLAEVQADLVLLIAALGIDLRPICGGGQGFRHGAAGGGSYRGRAGGGAEDRCPDHRHQQPQPEYSGGRSGHLRAAGAAGEGGRGLSGGGERGA